MAAWWAADHPSSLKDSWAFNKVLSPRQSKWIVAAINDLRQVFLCVDGRDLTREVRDSSSLVVFVLRRKLEKLYRFLRITFSWCYYCDTYRLHIMNGRNCRAAGRFLKNIGQEDDQKELRTSNRGFRTTRIVGIWALAPTLVLATGLSSWYVIQCRARFSEMITFDWWEENHTELYVGVLWLASSILLVYLTVGQKRSCFTTHCLL